MNVLSYNPAHDGAIAYLKSDHLLVSIEAEKNSNWRYSPISSRDVFDALGELDEIPDVICTGGWWPRDHYEYLHGSHVQYRGVSKSDVIIDQRRLLGRPGNPKIDWNVYSGLRFITAGSFDLAQYDIFETNYKMIADMLANDLILGWVSGKYEIGPRALGNRSILAAPFQVSTRVRLNEIKQREQFRPIAPVCLEEDAARWFGCDHASPYMLYTYRVRTDVLAAVTHVNGTARIQTVSVGTNRNMYDLLSEFKARTGYGVLCNTSLNFKGRGFINKIDDLSTYVIEHKLDGFVVEDKAYFLKSSTSFQAYLRMPNSIAAERSRIRA